MLCLIHALDKIMQVIANGNIIPAFKVCNNNIERVRWFYVVTSVWDLRPRKEWKVSYKCRSNSQPSQCQGTFRFPVTSSREHGWCLKRLAGDIYTYTFWKMSYQQSWQIFPVQTWSVTYTGHKMRHCRGTVTSRLCIQADVCHFKHFRQTHCNITSEANRTFFHKWMFFHIHLPLFFDISKSRSL